MNKDVMNKELNQCPLNQLYKATQRKDAVDTAENQDIPSTNVNKYKMK
jgi:hypothetical protein